MAFAVQPSYIRRELVEPELPPIAAASPFARTHARLFGGVFNTAHTIVSTMISAALV